MIFKNKTALLEYISSTILEDAENIEVVVSTPKCCESCKIDSSVLLEANLSFISDSPKIKVKVINEDANIIYVDNAEYIEGCCGTGKITVMGRELLMNMCEHDGHLNVNLNIAINEQTYYNVPFNVKLKHDDTIMCLTETFVQQTKK